MTPTFRNLLTILEAGASIELNPENLSLTQVRTLLRTARRHGAAVTLRHTTTFLPCEWELLAAEGGHSLTIASLPVT
jgi:hypothetical protein